MSDCKLKLVLFITIGILLLIIGYVTVDVFLFPNRPEKGQTVEDWGKICLWQDSSGINLSISPKGCYSTTCTKIDQQVGTVLVDTQSQEIHLDARFILSKTSRFPLPCIDNCLGGGSLLFDVSSLVPNDYTIWFKGQLVGDVMVFSGRETPRQCFENPVD